MKRVFLSLITTACLLLIAFPVSIYAEVDKDTVAVWLFDEGAGDTAKDISGNGHDGTLFGDTKWTDAKHGKGLDFSGAFANYVKVPHADDLNLEEWTIEGWFLIRSIVRLDDFDCPFAKESGSNRNYAFHIQGGGGTIHGSITIGGAFGHAALGVTNIDDGEWHYLAITYDGIKCTLYVDGEEDAGSEIGGPPDTNGGPITIGGTGARSTDGIIDEVRLSSIARTQEEIEEVMEKGLKVLIAVRPSGKLTTTWANIKLPGFM